MLTVLLVALALATAGADTAITRSDKIDGYVILDTSSVVVPADSLCARCGKKCVMTEYYSRGARAWDETLYPFWEPRCPDHGQHVEWLGPPCYTETLRKYDHVWHSIPGESFISTRTDSTRWHDYTNVTCADRVEIGLREDGIVVHRKLKP